MAKVIYIFPVNSSATLTVSNGTNKPSLEVFRTATYVTAAGSSSQIVPVAEKGGLTSGDTIYIGTNTAVAITSASGTGAGNILIASAKSWSNNDAVVVKRKTGDSTDAYATIYDDPDFATSITQTDQAFESDNDNEWVFFAKPGRYGVRIADASNNTLQLDADVTWDESFSIQVTPSHDSTTGGIQEALSKLPPTGGRVLLPTGTTSISTGVTLTTLQSIVGSGANASFISVTANVAAITVSNDVAGRQRMGLLQGFTIQPTIVNTNSMIRLNATNGMAIRDVVCNANDLVNTGKGIWVDECVSTTISECAVVDNTSTPTGTWAVGINVDGSDTTSLINVRFAGCTVGIDITNAAQQNSGTCVIGCDWNSVTTAIRSDSSGAANSLMVFGSAMATVTNRFTETSAASSESLSNIYVGYPDYQSTYFDSLFIQRPAYQTITAANTSLDYKHRNTIFISGNASYTLAGTGGNTAIIADGTDGQVLVIVNRDDNNTFTFPDYTTLATSNIRLRTNNVTLRPHDTLTLQYSADDSQWQEVTRNQPRRKTSNDTITSGNTSVVITHGLNFTPAASEIYITPTAATTADFGYWYVNTITSTQFTVNVATNPGASGFNFHWRVDLEPGNTP